MFRAQFGRIALRKASKVVTRTRVKVSEIAANTALSVHYRILGVGLYEIITRIGGDTDTDTVIGMAEKFAVTVERKDGTYATEIEFDFTPADGSGYDTVTKSTMRALKGDIVRQVRETAAQVAKEGDTDV